MNLGAEPDAQIGWPIRREKYSAPAGETCNVSIRFKPMPAGDAFVLQAPCDVVIGKWLKETLFAQDVDSDNQRYPENTALYALPLDTAAPAVEMESVGARIRLGEPFMSYPDFFSAQKTATILLFEPARGVAIGSVPRGEKEKEAAKELSVRPQVTSLDQLRNAVNSNNISQTVLLLATKVFTEEELTDALKSAPPQMQPFIQKRISALSSGYELTKANGIFFPSETRLDGTDEVWTEHLRRDNNSLTRAVQNTIAGDGALVGVGHGGTAVHDALHDAVLTDNPEYFDEQYRLAERYHADEAALYPKTGFLATALMFTRWKMILYFLASDIPFSGYGLYGIENQEVALYSEAKRVFERTHYAVDDRDKFIRDVAAQVLGASRAMRIAPHLFRRQ